MKIEIKHPDKLVSTGAYSAALECNGWVFVSGQGPLDLKTGAVVRGTIEEEVQLTMTHVGKLLAAAGCTFEDVVRCTCHLANINDFDRFNQIYASFFKGVLPTRTTVQSVLGDGIKVEIDCIAIRGGRQKRTAPKPAKQRAAARKSTLSSRARK